MSGDPSLHRNDSGESLDRLIASYLEREEAGGPQLDVEAILKDRPELREGFRSFLTGHRALKGQRRAVVTTEPLAGRKSPREDSLASLAATIQPGQVIGDCSLISELGRGGMGIVYLARHVRLRDLRAVKILPRDSVTDDRIKRFWREGQAAASINHLNVVKVHDVGRSGDLHYIVMQYVPGKTLQELVRERNAPLPWPDAFTLIRPLLDALAAMHHEKLIHRDIKPSNVMVTGGSTLTHAPHVLLMDFGLVHDEAKEGLTQLGVPMGTPAYMPPEQACGEKIDVRADLYSVGATLYYLVTGCDPFRGRRTEVYRKVASGASPASIWALQPRIPMPVCSLIERAMHSNRERRYSSAEDMLSAVSGLLSRADELQPGSGRAAPPPAQPPAALQDTGSLSADTFSSAPSLEPGSPAQSAPLTGAPQERVGISAELRIASQQRDRRTARQASAAWQRWAYALGALMIAATLAIGSMLLSGMSNRRPIENTKPSPHPTAAAALAHAGMVYVSAGPVHLGAREEDLRAHARSLDEVLDEPRLVEQFVACCLAERRETLDVGAFWIDPYEVTNGQYLKFVQATRRAAPAPWSGTTPKPGTDDHPVTEVTYDDAAAYADWAGKQLPTIAQWTRAFRGGDRRMYPWGDAWSSVRANVSENKAFATGTSPVSASPNDISPFGVFNLVGAVDEIMRERTHRDGQITTITKGAHSEALGAIYGAAPFQFFLLGEGKSGRLTGFRCVVEDRSKP